LPIKSDGNKVVKMGDVADIKRTFKDPSSFSRINGFDAISLSITKRVGFNELDIAQAVQAEVEKIREDFPDDLIIQPGLDTTKFAGDMVSELEGNIITAVILVMVLVVATLGLRNGLIVGIAIPFSFLVGFGILHFFIGYEFNFLVMFGMLLGLGMLIDGGIVIVEYADKLIDKGMSRKEAYTNAAERMFTPVFASVLTTLAAFSPLMIWPGISGKFMRYLPVTVFVILAASLAYALIFAPVIGSLLGRRKKANDTNNDSDDTPLKKSYRKAINFAVKNPVESVAYTFLTMFLILGNIVPNYGKQFVYFPSVEPWLIEADIQARGNLSPYEARDFAIDAEQKLIAVKGVDDLNISVSGGGGSGDGVGRGYIVLEDPKELDITGFEVLALLREAVSDISGYKLSIREVQEGPGQFSAPVEIQLMSEDLGLIERKTRELRNYIDQNIEGLTGVNDTLPKYKIEWKIDVDKERAFQSGISLYDIGSTIQMVTTGIMLGEYRPDDSKEEIDIRARFAKDKRTLSNLENITVNSRNGAVPVSSFVDVEARPNAASLVRRDGQFFYEINATNVPGFNLNGEINKIQQWIDDTGFDDPRMDITFGGLTERGAEATDFLIQAFYGALFLMFIILVTQFNSISQPIVILLSVLFSTAGVFLGLTVTGSEPSTIMTGTALVGLAGIVVNNNIVLIDTFNKLRSDFPDKPATELIAETCMSRLRPVLLTTVTTIFGLMFLSFGYSIDVINRAIYEGTSTVKWYQVFGISICWGLGFSTIITLLVTPSFLMILENLKEYRMSARNFVTSIPNKIGTLFKS
ncbi:MAG: efflux RND transporter permease subunit, partial [Pseudomonadota bacterium]|nr:efflux RND transporter permease subunit [Pseudomonadota bacterium]